MRRVRYSQFLAMTVTIGLFPATAEAHSGGFEVYATIALIAQFIAGPAAIISAGWFKGRRRVYFVGFLLGVVCSWIFFIIGGPFGMSAETYDMLTESLGSSSQNDLWLILFFMHFITIPFVALAAVWGAYALRRKYRGANQEQRK